MMMQKPMSTWQPLATRRPTMAFPPLLNTVQNCASVCEQMVTAMLGTPDIDARRTQIRLLVDCANICTLMASYLAANSPFAKPLASLCAVVCEACGSECARFPDQMSQMCSQICLNCAQECAMFSRT